MTEEARDQLKARRIAAARRVLAARPNASVRELARAVAIATKHRCNTTQASQLRDYIRATPEPAAAAT